MKVTIFHLSLEELKTMTTFANLEQALEGLEAVLTGVEATVAEEPSELSAKTQAFTDKLNAVASRIMALGEQVEAFSGVDAVEPPVEENPVVKEPVEVPPELV